jgi:hypothetical protein
LSGRSLSAIWDAESPKIHKLIEIASTLAMRAIVSSAADHENSPDRGLAKAAGLPGSLVDAMLQLEESSHPISVNIV